MVTILHKNSKYEPFEYTYVALVDVVWSNLNGHQQDLYFHPSGYIYTLRIKFDRFEVIVLDLLIREYTSIFTLMDYHMTSFDEEKQVHN